MSFFLCNEEEGFWKVYYFSRAAIIKFHELSNLNSNLCLIILEARNLKSSYQQGHTPSESSRKGSVSWFSLSFWWFAGNRWHSLVCRHIPLISASCSRGVLPDCVLYVQTFPIYKDTRYWIRELPLL